MTDEQVTLTYRYDLLCNLACEYFDLVRLLSFLLERHVPCGGREASLLWLIGNRFLDHIIEDGV